MAFAATTEWDVRTTGSDTNGGGFNTAASGTDRSQQDAAFITFTDLVIGGTNTQLTSAANPFGATSPGNIINITGGTGFTVQRVQIVSVAGAVATCDKAVGTASSTGGQGKLGGALLTISTAINTAHGGNTIWVKNGTYTLTVAVNWVNANASANNGITYVIGYNATHGDNGTGPTITTATNSVDLLTTAPGVTATLFLQNLNFTNTATTKGNGLKAVSSTVYLYVVNCSFNGFRMSIDSTAGFFALSLIGSSFRNSSNQNIQSSGGVPVHALGCYFAGTVSGSNSLWVTGVASVIGCVFAGNGYGLVVPGGANLCVVANNVFTGHANNGLHFSSPPSQVNTSIINNIFYGNTGFGIGVGAACNVPRWANAYGSNTAGNTQFTISPTELNAVTLTASPFTNTGTGDYSLNATAGGGAVCKAVGFPRTFGTATTGFLDIGAVQSAGSAGSTGNSGFTG